MWNGPSSLFYVSHVIRLVGIVGFLIGKFVFVNSCRRSWSRLQLFCIMMMHAWDEGRYLAKRQFLCGLCLVRICLWWWLECLLYVCSQVLRVNNWRVIWEYICSVCLCCFVPVVLWLARIPCDFSVVCIGWGGLTCNWCWWFGWL